MALRRLDPLDTRSAFSGRLFDRKLQEALARTWAWRWGNSRRWSCCYEQDGLTQAELCRRINVEQPTMANTLERMERDGLVERKADDTDRRRALVFLTQKAKDVRAQVLEGVRAVSWLARSRRRRPPTKTRFSACSDGCDRKLAQGILTEFTPQRGLTATSAFDKHKKFFFAAGAAPGNMTRHINI